MGISARFAPLLGLVAGLVLAAGSVACSATEPVAGSAPPRPTAPPQLTAPAPAPAQETVAGPVRLRLPEIAADASVVPVGVDERGEMAVPPDVRTVGWYRFGPAPGASAGSSVLAGHVDDQVQGRGAFYRLRELAEGDLVQVELADGRVLEYRVRDTALVTKAELPTDRIFAREGPPQLVLVTCGGPFERDRRSYRDNVVITADPAA